MADPAAPMTDAQRRAAARKAKILARGNAGLARLAQTARGDEADMLYGEDTSNNSAPSSAPASRPDTPASDKPGTTAVPSTSTPSAPSGKPTRQASTSTQSSTTSRPGWAPPTTTSAPRDPRDPRAAPSSAEQEQMRAQLDAMMAMLGGGGAPGAGAGAGAPPDMSNLLASLMGGMPPPGAGSAGGPGLLGDSEFPSRDSPNPFAGLGGMGGMDPSQNPFAALGMDPGQNPFAAMGGGGMPPGMESMFPGLAPPQPKSRAARSFPLVHMVTVLGLVVFICAWWEPTLHAVRWGGAADGGLRTTVADGFAGRWGAWAERWATLGGSVGKGVNAWVEPIPVFYAFLTLELILLATRMTLVRTPPSLHPLLANVLPMLPPAIGRTITIGSKYLGVAGQVYRDACLLVFGLGGAIVLAGWLAARA